VSGCEDGSSVNGRSALWSAGFSVWKMHLEAGVPRFSTIVATHPVQLACELPEDEARSLSTWTCAELARTLIRDRIVDTIPSSSVQRILAAEKLKPWRVHHWLSSKVARDDQFRATVHNICDLYTRKLGPDERVLSLDERPSLQPRTRTSRNCPAPPGNGPVVVEHEYVRKGALNLFAAFDTRTGRVLGILRKRKRQVEFIELLEAIDRTTPASVRLVHALRDNLSIHNGKLARAWLAAHPRLRMHFTPVHCSLDEPGGAVVLDSPAQAATRTELRRPRGSGEQDRAPSLACRAPGRTASLTRLVPGRSLDLLAIEKLVAEGRFELPTKGL
jgi:hypothetical protein